MRRGNRRYAMSTRCKSWRCKPCKRAKIRVMSERISQACSSAVRPYFVSVTYGLPVEMRESCETILEKYRSTVAASAVKDYREFLRRFQRKHKRKLKWIRIPELTKSGMIHWHMVMDNMPPGTDRCKTRMGNKFHKDKSCQCLTHLVSREWYSVTGWFVVDVREVYSGPGMGTYLGGYLTKMSEVDYEWLAANGITRRIDTSRGFGRLPKLHRAGGIWGYDRVDFVYGPGSSWHLQWTKKQPEMQPMGGLWSPQQKREMALRRLLK